MASSDSGRKLWTILRYFDQALCVHNSSETCAIYTVLKFETYAAKDFSCKALKNVENHNPGSSSLHKASEKQIDTVYRHTAWFTVHGGIAIKYSLTYIESLHNFLCAGGTRSEG